MAKRRSRRKSDDPTPEDQGVFSADELEDVDLEAELADLEEFATQADAAAAPVGGEFVPDDLLDAKRQLLDMIGPYEEEDGDFELLSGMSGVGIVPDKAWAGRSNIVGVGVGPELFEGEMTGRDAVVVFVAQKLDEASVVKDLRIPKTIGGRPTDVIVTGPFMPHNGMDRRFARPVPCGTSIGRMGAGTVGTLGALVVTKDRTPCILSNNHVIGDQSTQRPAEQRIVQPGVRGADAMDVIAVNPRSVEFDFSHGAANFVDAAIAETRVTSAGGKPPLVRPEMFARNPDRLLRLGPNYEAPRRGLIVQKTGRTTATTVGSVFHTNVDRVPIRYKDGTVVFDDQTAVRSLSSKPFSMGGDSGSLVIRQDNSVPVGLLFAGSAAYTLINPMPTVMKVLKQRFGVIGILRQVT